MPVLQSKFNANQLQVIYGDDFNGVLLKPYVNKPRTPVYDSNIRIRNVSEIHTEILSLGLLIPFQPSIWDYKITVEVWNNFLRMVKIEMELMYSKECTDKIIVRLQKLFSNLNFNTHRKSLAVVLTPAEDKIIYLDVPVKPLVFFGKSISVLDLAASIQQEPDFYYLVLHERYTSLYEYNHNQFRKIYKQHNETCHISLFKKTAAVIELLNDKNEKPLFVTGSPNLVEQFCNSEYYKQKYISLLHHKGPFSIEIIQSLVKEIIGHWGEWKSIYFKGVVVLAQKTNRLVSNKESVFRALQTGADGFLLMDKGLQRELLKSTARDDTFQNIDELMSQIEKFLARGNRFEIVDSDLLKNMGGIALLGNNSTCVSGLRIYKKREAVSARGGIY